MATRLAQITATGTVYNGKGYLKSLILAGGSDAATAAIKDGSGGGAIATLKAAAGTTATWSAGDPVGVFFGTTIYATLTGTSPTLTGEFDPA